MIKHLSRISLWIFASAALFLTACDDDDEEDNPPPPAQSQDIVNIAQANANFSILVEALVAADLVTTLEAAGPFTVFAPNNDAFNALFNSLNLTDDNANGSRVDELVAAVGADAVESILLYHVVGSEIPSSAVTGPTYVSTASIASPGANPLSLLAEPFAQTVRLNGAIGATVLTPDIDASNGVIHEIDAVLELPDVLFHAQANSSLTSLVNDLTFTNLTNALDDPDTEYTIFAPDNQAYTNNEDVLMTLSTDDLSEVLQYHVLVSQVRSSEISDGQTANTFQGQGIAFTVEGSTISVIDTEGNASTVTTANIQGTNGVIHIINGFLLPVL